MMKHLMVGAAAGALMISAAAAQAPSSSDSTPSTPPAAQSMPATGSGNGMVTSQKPDQLMASSFKGTDVIGSDDKKIGDISDILFTKDGKIEAYVVAVGGFLGMGAKEVAMPPAQFTVVSGDKSKGEADKLKVSVTEDQLKQAQNFTRYEPPRATTTGSGPAGSRPSTPPASR